MEKTILEDNKNFYPLINNPDNLQDINMSKIQKVNSSNLHNSDFILNNTNIEEEVINKINQEPKIYNIDSLEQKEIYNKYNKVSEVQFKDLIKDKKYK